MNAEKTKADERVNAHRPDDSPGQEQIADTMARQPQSVKHGVLRTTSQRCMLAALGDGAVFALARGREQQLYRRAYSSGGQVVGLPVDADGAELGAPPRLFPDPLLTMVYPAELGGES